MSTEENIFLFNAFLFCRECDKFTIHYRTISGLYKCRVCGKERLLRR